MTDEGPVLDWLADGEDVFFFAKAITIVQEARKTGRRRGRGRAYLTDRRIVIRRGKSFFVDVPRTQITAARSLPTLRTTSAYYQPLPGRRVLRLVVETEDREIIVGIVLRTVEAKAWQDELKPDVAVNTGGRPRLH